MRIYRYRGGSGGSEEGEWPPANLDGGEIVPARGRVGHETVSWVGLYTTGQHQYFLEFVINPSYNSSWHLTFNTKKT